MSHNNNESSFKVILTGSLIPGVSLEEAEKRLSQLFNTTPEKVRPLLQGRATTIKNDLNAEYSDRYRQVLTKVGVGFEIIEERPKPSPQPKKPVVISQKETNIINNEKNSEPLLFLKNLHYPKKVKSQYLFELNEEIEELQRQINFIYQESKGPIFINLQDRYNFFVSIFIIMQIMVMIAVGIATTWYWSIATIIPAIFIFPYFISLFNASLEHKYLQFLLKELWQHPRISDPLFLAVFHYTSLQGIENISTKLESDLLKSLSNRYRDKEEYKRILTDMEFLKTQLVKNKEGKLELKESVKLAELNKKELAELNKKEEEELVYVEEASDEAIRWGWRIKKDGKILAPKNPDQVILWLRKAKISLDDFCFNVNNPEKGEAPIRESLGKKEYLVRILFNPSIGMAMQLAHMCGGLSAIFCGCYIIYFIYANEIYLGLMEPVSNFEFFPKVNWANINIGAFLLGLGFRIIFDIIVIVLSIGVVIMAISLIFSVGFPIGALPGFLVGYIIGLFMKKELK